MSSKFLNLKQTKSQSLSKIQGYCARTVDTKLSTIFTLFCMLYFFAFSVIYRRGFLLNYGFPFNSFLPAPVTLGGDFFGVFDIWKLNAGFGGVGYGASYFPGLYIFIELMTMISQDSWFGLKLLWICYLITISVLTFLFLRSCGLITSVMGLTIILFSYPSLIALHTGNIEMLVCILLFGGAVSAYEKKWTLFSICIGTATSFKGFPGIFVLAPFLLTNKKAAIKSLFSSVKTSLFLTSLAIFLLPGGIRDKGFGSFSNLVRSLVQSQQMYEDLMVTGVPGIHFGHSLLNGVHAVMGMGFLPSEIWAYPIMAIGVVWTVTSFYLLRNSYPPIWLIFGFLGCSGCIFAPTSTDYKLFYILPAILLYIRESDSLLRSKFMICLLIVSIVPKPYLYVGNNQFTNANVWLTPITLLIFQICALSFLLSKKQNKERVNQ